MTDYDDFRGGLSKEEWNRQRPKAQQPLLGGATRNAEATPLQLGPAQQLEQQLESARRGVTIGALEERVAALGDRFEKLSQQVNALCNVDNELSRRLTMLETTVNKFNPRHWGVTDGHLDPSVQLRREVGTLVRAARKALPLLSELSHEAAGYAQEDLRRAIEVFAADY